MSVNVHPKTMREALEFYAACEAYVGDTIHGGYTVIGSDKGQVAREALSRSETATQRVKVVLSNGEEDELDCGTFAGVHINGAWVIDIGTGTILADRCEVDLPDARHRASRWFEHQDFSISPHPKPFRDIFIHPVN